MINEENQTDNINKIKIDKLKVTKLFYEMNPLRDPKIRLKIAEDIFLNNCIRNNLSQRENHSLSDRKKFPKINIDSIKYAYNFSTKQTPINTIYNKDININNIYSKYNAKDILITSLKILPKNRFKYIKNKKNNEIKKSNNNVDNNAQKKYCLNKIKPKSIIKQLNNKKIEGTLNVNAIKKKLSLNSFDKDYTFNLDSNNHCLFYRSNNYDIKKYYRSNMVLPKITKKYILPSFENNKSKEIKDIFTLKRYQMKVIEESLKLKPFLH